jgi:hypothetical protein
MAGRKRLLTDASQREICALISAGCGLTEAAKYVRCTPITIRREAQRNPEFADRIRNAQMSAQLTPLQSLRKASASHWRAAAWLLERIEPNRFVKRNPQMFTDKQWHALIKQLVQVIHQEIPDPAVRQRIVDRLDEIQRNSAFDVWAANSTYAQVDKAHPKPKHQPPDATQANKLPALSSTLDRTEP